MISHKALSTRSFLHKVFKTKHLHLDVIFDKMATMHGRGKGRSGSKKPEGQEKPVWVKHTKEEIESIIVKLAKQGMQPGKIGLVLRDAYGIPLSRPITGKKIYQIMKEKGLGLKEPADLTNLIKRAEQLKKHLEKNKHDKTAKRGLQLTEAKVRRLARYYRDTGVLDPKWKY
ncbi:MAG: 30S ribosomal protein S15, small subunit ribosomal protein S15 [archaeon GW2011_AR6]|nr:MAG: 30S ribosomal protein S15, small subunit ribosomal protein S15 [archaeon GW2011_AR6]